MVAVGSEFEVFVQRLGGPWRWRGDFTGDGGLIHVDEESALEVVGFRLAGIDGNRFVARGDRAFHAFQVVLRHAQVEVRQRGVRRQGGGSAVRSYRFL